MHPTAKLSEDMNRKCPPRNMMLQLSTPYFDPERHSVQLYRYTDGQMVKLS